MTILEPSYMETLYEFVIPIDRYFISMFGRPSVLIFQILFCPSQVWPEVFRILA
jgi:hypothetical protein